MKKTPQALVCLPFQFLSFPFLLTMFIMAATVNPLMAQKDKPVAPELPRNDDDSLVYYMEVIPIDDADNIELFKRARIWINDYYKNPGSIIEELDSVNGKIVLKPQFPTYRTLKNEVKAQSAIVRYTLVLGFKDGKYRYEIKDLNLKAESYFPIEKLFNEKEVNSDNIADNFNTLKETDIVLRSLINNLKETMKEPSVKVKKDEW